MSNNQGRNTGLLSILCPWLIELLAEVTERDVRKAEPDEEVQAWEEVVGNLDFNELRNLFALISIMGGWRMGVPEIKGGVKKKLDESAPSGLELILKMDFARELFWTAVRDRFDLWTEEAIFIRKGWKLAVPRGSAWGLLPRGLLSRFKER